MLYSAKGFSGDLTGTATKATQDASGNVITSTYETKADATTKINNMDFAFVITFCYLSVCFFSGFLSSRLSVSFCAVQGVLYLSHPLF